MKCSIIPVDTSRPLTFHISIHRISGFFQLFAPQLCVRDPEAIKQILVKDFDHFEDHTLMIDVSAEPLIGNSLMALTGEKWHHMRATLSPAFTGSKMRLMFQLVTEYTDEAAQLLLQKSKSEKLDLEMKDLFSRYSNDIIATCAFGLKVSSIAEPDNGFYAKSKNLLNTKSWLQMMKFLVIICAPKLARLLKIAIFDKAYMAEFRSMILDTMHARRKQSIHRPDMINLLLQVRDGSLKHQAHEEEKAEGFATVEESAIGKRSSDRNWTDEELVAQCFLFFFAGLETVSTTLTFTSYELMVNPDIQQKLFEEIRESDERLDGKRISYDELQKLKYLDQVICEVLRKWPSAGQSERICVKDYQYKDSKKEVIIEKGTSVMIPTYGLHHDERYYPEPEKFNPERFSDENKMNIIPGSYIPFGLGPRNCIGKRMFQAHLCSIYAVIGGLWFVCGFILGSRFALMEVKAILYYLLLKFSFERNEKTVVPIQIEPIPLFAVKNGLHLELRPRTKH